MINRSDLLARLTRGRSGARQPFDFDALAQDLAAGLSRREALRRLGLGLAGALLAALGPAPAAQADPPCPPGQKRCFGRCVDRQTDPDHCGGCGRVCPTSRACQNGQCRPCPAGTTLCSGPFGRACCPSTQPTCCSGVCCVAGQYCCSNLCSVCPCDQTVCTGSQGTTCCVAGETCCDGACVNTQTDLDHCGACNNACAADETCLPGVGCCKNSSVCGSACCPTDQQCLEREGRLFCCTQEKLCEVEPDQFVCCGPGTLCVEDESGPGNLCCPFPFIFCAGVCCGPGQRCMENEHGPGERCCPSDSTGACDGICCGPGTLCVEDESGPGNLCCPFPYEACAGVCCGPNQRCLLNVGCQCADGFSPCGTDPLVCCNDATEVCRNGICIAGSQT